MRSPRIHPLILGQFLLMAGCAQLVWEKPNAEPAAIKQDLEQCQQLARLQTTWLSRDTVATPKVEISPIGLPVFATQPPDQSERLLREHDLTNSCMQQKGYRLGPAKPDDRR
jgi:hypothetical protein